MDKLIRVQLGRNVETLRKRAGLTRADLAKAASLSRMTIWRVETGSCPANLDALGAIAKALNVSPGRLLREESQVTKSVRRSA